MPHTKAQPADRLSALPTELLCHIAHKTVTLADRKALVLVSRAWANVTLPFLQNTLPTDLVNRGTRNILGITQASSNNLKHVHNIVLLSGTCNEYDFMDLLASIARG